jgi:hypothetical protein
MILALGYKACKVHNLVILVYEAYTPYKPGFIFEKEDVMYLMKINRDLNRLHISDNYGRTMMTTDCLLFHPLEYIEQLVLA